jgi:hypothetical protein
MPLLWGGLKLDWTDFYRVSEPLITRETHGSAFSYQKPLKPS